MAFEFEAKGGTNCYYEGEEISMRKAQELIDRGLWYTLEDGKMFIYGRDDPDAPWNGDDT